MIRRRFGPIGRRTVRGRSWVASWLLLLLRWLLSFLPLGGCAPTLAPVTEVKADVASLHAKVQDVKDAVVNTQDEVGLVNSNVTAGRDSNDAMTFRILAGGLAMSPFMYAGSKLLWIWGGRLRRGRQRTIQRSGCGGPFGG